MPKEIERKFKVKKNWKSEFPEIEGFVIEQGFLNRDKNRVVRVRIKGEQGFLTIKGKNKGNTRAEYEYEIQMADAEELILLCEKPIIEKVRYELPYGDHVWELDVFKGLNQGLLIAEIELEDENEVFELPDWLGEEVSGDERYYNSNLVAFPFSEWE